MNRDQILQIISSNKLLVNYCKKLYPNHYLSDDLYQEFFLYMCEKKEAELVKIYESGGLDNYCIAVIFRKSRERFNTTAQKNPMYCLTDYASEYNNQVLPVKEHSDEYLTNFERVMDVISKKANPVDVAVLFESLSGKLTDLSRATGIPYVTIKSRKKKVVDIVKAHVKL